MPMHEADGQIRQKRREAKESRPRSRESYVFKGEPGRLIEGYMINAADAPNNFFSVAPHKQSLTVEEALIIWKILRRWFRDEVEKGEIHVDTIGGDSAKSQNIPWRYWTSSYEAQLNQPSS